MLEKIKEERKGAPNSRSGAAALRRPASAFGSGRLAGLGASVKHNRFAPKLGQALEAYESLPLSVSRSAY